MVWGRVARRWSTSLRSAAAAPGHAVSGSGHAVSGSDTIAALRRYAAEHRLNIDLRTGGKLKRKKADIVRAILAATEPATEPAATEPAAALLAAADSAAAEPAAAEPAAFEPFATEPAATEPAASQPAAAAADSAPLLSMVEEIRAELAAARGDGDDAVFDASGFGFTAAPAARARRRLPPPEVVGADDTISEMRYFVKRHDVDVAVKTRVGRAKADVAREINDIMALRHAVAVGDGDEWYTFDDEEAPPLGVVPDGDAEDEPTDAAAAFAPLNAGGGLNDDEGDEEEGEEGEEDEFVSGREDLFCFDAADDRLQLVRRSKMLRRPGDMVESPELVVSDETDAIFALMPDELTRGVFFAEDEDGEAEAAMRRRNVTDIVLDVGRRPYAWINNVRMMMGPEDGVLSTCDLERILARTSPLCQDNRGGLVGTLHRVSAIRNRQNDVVGATLRFGRHIAGVAAIVADLLHSSDKSILFVGEPGCGKSTVIRDAACELARRQNVLVVDTSCELGGPADVPHACLGLARRMQVPSLALQASVMVECVQNHTPSVIVVDEIGRPSEVEAARTCKMRGVRIIASAHGDLAGLVRNKELADLVGGVALVTLSDIEARAESRRRGRSSELRKTRPERKTEPIFDIVVELKRDSPHSWRVVLDVARAVDTILVSGRYAVQHRRRSAEGGPIAVSHGTADVPHAQWMSDYF